MALRCQAGDPGAFEDLIAVMERSLLYYAMTLTGNADSALDVLQDMWLKVFRGIRHADETPAHCDRGCIPSSMESPWIVSEKVRGVRRPSSLSTRNLSRLRNLRLRMKMRRKFIKR